MKSSYSILNSDEILEILRARLKEKNLTVYALSSLCGISQSTLSRYFNKKIEMSLSSFLKLIEALEMRIYIQPDEFILDEFSSKL